MGIAIFGIVGGMGEDIFPYPGVIGDLSEDWECEEREVRSPRVEEFLRVLLEVVEPDLPLREKSPILKGLGWGR